MHDLLRAIVAATAPGVDQAESLAILRRVARKADIIERDGKVRYSLFRASNSPHSLMDLVREYIIEIGDLAQGLLGEDTRTVYAQNNTPLEGQILFDNMFRRIQKRMSDSQIDQKLLVAALVRVSEIKLVWTKTNDPRAEYVRVTDLERWAQSTGRKNVGMAVADGDR